MTAPAPVSRRATAVAAFGYDDFPVRDRQLDLRGDSSPPLPAAATFLARPTTSPQDVAAYSEVAGDPRLRAILGELLGVTGTQVVVTAGGSEALFLALTCVADPGDTVHLPRPGFPGFEQLAHLAGLRATPYDVPGTPACRRDGEPAVICTPHNPTGVVTTPAAVSGVSGGWTIWDLSHMALTGPAIADLVADLGDRDLVVFSLSKLLRLPGARVGCLAARDPGLLAAAVRVKTHLSMSSNQHGQQLARAVLSDPGTARELDRRQTAFTDFRTRILDAVAASQGLTAVPAADGTHVYLRTRDGAPAWNRLAEAGVIGIPGTVFYDWPDAVRLCIAQPDDVVNEAAWRVKAL